jgi:hypothetical protein
MENKQTQKNNKFMFKWKKRFGDDRSFSWLECHIKELGWTYGIEEGFKKNGYTAWVELVRFAEPVTIIKKPAKTIEEAEKECKKHFVSTSDKIQEYIKKNKVK